MDDELPDELVIRDRTSFRRRFGPGFDWPRRQREALVRLIHEKDLTDSEIKLFRRTGNLIRTPFGVRLAASNKWVLLIGVVQLVLFTLMLAGTLAIVWPHLFALNQKAVSAWGLVISFAAFCVCFYLVYILPWLILRRTERLNYNNIEPPQSGQAGPASPDVNQ